MLSRVVAGSENELHAFGTSARPAVCSAQQQQLNQQQYPGLQQSSVASAPTAETQSKDWTCPNCSNSNFAFRTECHRCNVQRPLGSVAGENEDLRVVPITAESSIKDEKKAVKYARKVAVKKSKVEREIEAQKAELEFAQALAFNPPAMSNSDGALVSLETPARMQAKPKAGVEAMHQDDSTDRTVKREVKELKQLQKKRGTTMTNLNKIEKKRLAELQVSEYCPILTLRELTLLRSSRKERDTLASHRKNTQKNQTQVLAK